MSFVLSELLSLLCFTYSGNRITPMHVSKRHCHSILPSNRSIEKKEKDSTKRTPFLIESKIPFWMDTKDYAKEWFFHYVTMLIIWNRSSISIHRSSISLLPSTAKKIAVIFVRTYRISARSEWRVLYRALRMLLYVFHGERKAATEAEFAGSRGQAITRVHDRFLGRVMNFLRRTAEEDPPDCSSADDEARVRSAKASGRIETAYVNPRHADSHAIRSYSGWQKEFTGLYRCGRFGNLIIRSFRRLAVLDDFQIGPGSFLAISFHFLNAWYFLGGIGAIAFNEGVRDFI